MVVEESDLYSMGQCYRTTLGTTSWVLIFLLLTSCAYHTKIPCPYGLTMSQLDEKCDYIQHGSTTKWVLKKKK
jgi:hypothetical protein